jgi:uncharacterized membrane protein YeaQ/YmgE (transglycosylase-associated protein family)
MDGKSIVIALVMGLVAGWLASWVVGGGGLVRNLIIGVIGSYVGNILLARLGINLGLENEYARDIATATIGAIAVVLVAKFIA